MTKLLKKIIFLLPIPAVVFATTWIVDPAKIKNDDSYETGVASILLSGKNVANLVNFKERKLQQKIVFGLLKAPDVIVLGSSRSMPINLGFFPGKSFLNNSVSGASIEDYLGIFDLYRKRGLKPKLVIIGLDPWVLNRNNDQKRWEDLIDEYIEMKSILGFASNHKKTIREALSYKLRNYLNYKEFLSPGYFSQSCIELLKKGLNGNIYWATDKFEDEVPIKMADGSYVYGRKLRNIEVGDINRDAKSFAMTTPIYSLGNFTKLDKTTMQLLDSFIYYLDRNGIKVLLFLPPYHHIVYETIKANSSYSMVAESEFWYRSLAIKHNIAIMGSFDPKKLNLNESDFYDGMHAKNQAVRRIFESSLK